MEYNVPPHLFYDSYSKFSSAPLSDSIFYNYANFYAYSEATFEIVQAGQGCNDTSGAGALAETQLFFKPNFSGEGDELV